MKKAESGQVDILTPSCLTRDRTQSSDPMSDKPMEPGLFAMASDRIVLSHVGQTCQTGLSDIASDNCVQCRFGQACPTYNWTIVSDAVSDKPTGWGLFSSVANNLCWTCKGCSRWITVGDPQWLVMKNLPTV
jgi:hypothetical protein